MLITLNKKEEKLADKTTVEGLLSEKGAKRAAVWVNGRQLLLSEYADWVLKHGDNVKLLRVVAGG